LGEGRGNAFIRLLKRGREEIAVGAGNSGENSGTSEEAIPEGQAGEWRKKLRKPPEEGDRKAVFGKTERTV
jgi:hypothetical protein